MLKKALLILTLFLTGCSTTIVYAPKYNYNIAEGQSIIEAFQENKGSDLEGNRASQESQGDLTLPLK